MQSIMTFNFILRVANTILISVLCTIVYNGSAALGAPFKETVVSPIFDTSREIQERCEQPFRSINGICTGRVTEKCGNRLWGSAGSPHFSYIPGHSSRVPVRTGQPSPRLISNVISSQTDPIPNRRGITEFFVFFGEFLDHNIIATEITEDEHMDISIPENDALRSNFTSGNLRFTRAHRVKVPGEKGAVRALNSISSAIDLSPVYSSSAERMQKLRTFKDGKLRTSAGNFMPFNGARLHNEPSNSVDFFLAGDVRANDHPVLTSLHTVFLREHNYWCDRLAKQYLDLNDEELFQHSRKINIAQFQKIVFEQFIPTITGRRLSAYRGHRPCVNPSTSDIFSTAAYRIGHTLVGNNVQRRGPGMKTLPSLDFTQMFFRPAQTFLNNGMESFLRGAIDTTAQEVDTLVSSSLRNFLFSNVPEFRHFVDLIAINIQRGRDNALPGYNGVRTLFGLKPVQKFSDISSSTTVQSQLSTLYNTPDDVDPWIGLMAEDHAPGASMGPTVRKIWEDEFTRMRDGDQFFYQQNSLFNTAMTKDFPELAKVSNGDNDKMKELLLRHTSIKAEELPSSLFIQS